MSSSNNHATGKNFVVCYDKVGRMNVTELCRVANDICPVLASAAA